MIHHSQNRFVPVYRSLIRCVRIVTLAFTIVGALSSCGGAVAPSTPDGSAAAALPNTAVLAWNAVTVAGVAGYRVYYGTAAGTYLQPMGQGLPVEVGTTTYQLTGLSNGTTYYMAVTAFDSQGVESAYSNEVSKVIP